MSAVEREYDQAIIDRGLVVSIAFEGYHPLHLVVSPDTDTGSLADDIKTNEARVVVADISFVDYPEETAEILEKIVAIAGGTPVVVISNNNGIATLMAKSVGASNLITIENFDNDLQSTLESLHAA